MVNSLIILYFKNIFGFLIDHIINDLNILIGKLLKLVNKLVHLVLGDIGLTQFLKGIVAIPSYITYGDLIRLSLFLDLLDKLLSSLLRKLGEYKPDNGSVVCGIDPQIRGLNGLFNLFKKRLVPGLYL